MVPAAVPGASAVVCATTDAFYGGGWRHHATSGVACGDEVLYQIARSSHVALAWTVETDLAVWSCLLPAKGEGSLSCTGPYPVPVTPLSALRTEIWYESSFDCFPQNCVAGPYASVTFLH